MHHEEYCQRSLELFGDRHDAVHVFLDQYAERFSGLAHRLLLHHALGVVRVVAALGEGARRPAEQHIPDDLGRVPAEPDFGLLGYMAWLPANLAMARDIQAELRRLYSREFGQEQPAPDLPLEEITRAYALRDGRPYCLACEPEGKPVTRPGARVVSRGVICALRRGAVAVGGGRQGGRLMHIEAHCQRSLELFGERYEAVHAFLDQYFARWRGGIHRVLLHHALGVDLVVDTLGESARRPAEQHILDDFGRIPAAPDDPFLVLRCWYPLGEGAEVLDELRRLYGRDFDLEA